VLLIVVFTAV